MLLGEHRDAGALDLVLHKGAVAQAGAADDFGGRLALELGEPGFVLGRGGRDRRVEFGVGVGTPQVEGPVGRLADHLHGDGDVADLVGDDCEGHRPRLLVQSLSTTTQAPPSKRWRALADDHVDRPAVPDRDHLAHGGADRPVAFGDLDAGGVGELLVLVLAARVEVVGLHQEGLGRRLHVGGAVKGDVRLIVRLFEVGGLDLEVGRLLQLDRGRAAAAKGFEQERAGLGQHDVVDVRGP